MRALLARKPIGKVLFSYSGTNITTAAWVQIIAQVPTNCSSIDIFDGSGRILKLSIGTAGNEDAGELPFYIFPGGQCSQMPFEIAKGKRLSAKAIDGTANANYMLLNFFG